MECLKNLVGLRGKCGTVGSVANVWLDDKVTLKELEQIIDQNDHLSVEAMFDRWREQAVREVVDTINEGLAGRYIHRTVIGAKQVGTTADKLKAVLAEAKIKGFKFHRCNEWPSVAYRLTRVGFIGQYTGNVVVNYWDGITGQLLGSDTVAATADEWSWLDVNRLFRGVRVLLVGYDATTVNAYSTQVCPSICYTCPNARRVNAHVDGYGFASDVADVVGTLKSSNEAAGLSVVMAMECDTEGWLCSVKQQLALPMLWKVSQLAMEYAMFNTDRSNTKTLRDAGKLEERHLLYRTEYEASMKRALGALVLPNDPICFKCNRTSRIAVAIP